MSITVVMPVYFINEELIQLTRDALFSIKGQWDELIMIDDGSPIQTSEFKRQVTKHIRNEKNLGYIRSANRGFDEIRTEYGILVCNDTRLIEGKLIDLCGEGFVFPTFEGKTEPMWDGAFYGFKMDGNYHKYDERYKNYFGDLDKFYNAKKTSIPLTKTDKVKVWHKQSATTSKVGRNELYDQDYKVFKDKWNFDPIPVYGTMI